MGMSESFPAPVYAETILAPNFEHAKKHLLESLIQIHYAHTRMLAKQRIITEQEERILVAALDGLDRARIDRAVYDGSREDLFYFIEGILEESCGEVAGQNIAGKLHTARS